jgi:hypothetical protein
MKPNHAVILFFFLAVSASSSWSKSERWRIIAANGDTISNVLLERLEEDSLVVATSPEQPGDQNLKWIAVTSIAELRQIKNTKFGKGAGIGFLGGMVVGAVIGATLSNASEPVIDSGDSFALDLSEMSKGMSILAGGFLGGIAGFGLGGAIGSAAGKDEVYDLSRMDAETKVKTIQWILSKDNAEYW